MSNVIKIKKGLNIPLEGEAEKSYAPDFKADKYAIKPTDFRQLRPKLLINEGDKVLAGTPLFFHKDNPNIQVTSPVSGTIEQIKRGEKRIIEEIIINPDKTNEYIDFGKADPLTLSREEIIEKLCKSGLWPFIRQRPFSIIANPKDNPKAIFISCFDTAPLAPDLDFIAHGKGEIFQTGLNAISKLTNGKVHLNVCADYKTTKVFTNSKNVKINYFSGPHPAGNVGVQIHHIDPINKGEIVWYLYPQDVLAIGTLFLEGRISGTRIIALTGSEVKYRRYYKTYIGASVSKMLENNLLNENVRVISGNCLTGKKISPNGFIGFYDTQVTVLPEGNYHEFMGWLMPGFKHYSASRTLISSFFPFRKKKYRLDTNLHGGIRAFVLSGQYEKVFPFNIYPVQLLKAILTENIELMEDLGIYEVAEEDFALCEFVCTSKIDVQEIVRKGLELIQREMQ